MEGKTKQLPCIWPKTMGCGDIIFTPLSSMSIWENNPPPCRTSLVSDPMCYSDDNTRWILIMTPLASPSTHIITFIPSFILGAKNSARFVPNWSRHKPTSAGPGVSRRFGGDAIFGGQGDVSGTDCAPPSLGSCCSVLSAVLTLYPHTSHQDNPLHMMRFGSWDKRWLARYVSDLSTRA